MKFLVASHNKGKLKEIAEILRGHECVPLPDDCEAPEENGATFAENARIKARAALGEFPVIADDSGLCVNSLGGAPGVLSARYGGMETDAERNALLLSRMEGITDRSAYFECAIVCLFPDGREITASGRCHGVITHAPRGGGGFGYDCVFEMEGGQTTAEMSADTKNSISHRGKALKKLSELLEELH